MQTAQVVRNPSDSKFPPSLSLDGIRRAVGALSERYSDVLAYIDKGDAELCSISGAGRDHIEDYLAKIYKNLGIVPQLSPVERRRAASLMNKIYETDGWRPNAEETAFLIAARNGAVDSEPGPGAPAIDPDTVVVPIGGNVDNLNDDLSAQTGEAMLPTIQAVMEGIDKLTPWRLLFLDWVVRGISKEEMLNELRAKDPNADLSTIDHNLRRLYKALGIRHRFEDERARTIVLEAYERCKVAHKQPQTPSEPEAPPEPTTQGAVVTTTPEDLEPILARIAVSIADGRLTDRRIRFLDLLVSDKDYEYIATELDTTVPNVRNFVFRLRELFEIPQGTAEKVRARAAQERVALIAAWRLYRERNPLLDTSPPVADSDEGTDRVPPPEPEAPLAPESPTAAEEPVVEEATPAAPEAAIVKDPVPAPRASQLEHHTTVANASDGLLRSPQDIRAVRMLWSNSPTFEDDQLTATEAGYAIERVEHIVSFHPVFQSASVLTLVKRF